MVTEKGAGGARFGKNPAKVGVAGAVADVKEDGTGKRGSPVRGGSDFGPEDGLKAGFPGGGKNSTPAWRLGSVSPTAGRPSSVARAMMVLTGRRES